MKATKKILSMLLALAMMFTLMTAAVFADTDAAEPEAADVPELVIAPAPEEVIAPAPAQHGTVTLEPAEAEAGAAVTLTVKADKGWTLETLTVTDAEGAEIELTMNEDGTYTFTMPEGTVETAATFMEDNTMLNYFMDVTAADDYYDAVLWAAQNEITGGTDSIHFSPDMTATRAQMVTLMWKAAGCPVVNYAMSFEDVADDDYFAEAVRWAASTGVTAGTSETTFSPYLNVTREQAATLVYNYVKAQGNGFTGAWMFLLNYEDAASISSWANEAMHWCVMKQIAPDFDGTALAPQKAATRAEVVTMLYGVFAEQAE